MLPNPTQEERIATGFNRNVMLNEEGGVDQGEQRWLRLCDMVATTSQTWLGETIQCATCHDHKYDPIRQKDFYSFLAFFESADTPDLELRPALNKQRADIRTEIDRKQKEIDALPKNSPSLVQKKVDLQELNDRLGLLSGPDTPIFQEKAGAMPSTFIRIKGTYLAPGDKVNADVPPALGGLAPGMPKNRLGLAEWLASKSNPLTARVEMNRLWEMLFGRGIVETSENFGTQGTPPSNQPLLDWLATEFMARNWDIKAMLRLIVTSSAYRQVSDASEGSLRLDPLNVLISRGPRFRMEAEMIRDNDLSAAGLLNLKVGGPSVMPFQPDGIWDSPYSGERWANATGSERYRRGLYTFWKRTAPYPSFVTLDATSRESCTVRRIRSNTPLQALDLLNDEAYMEAARAIGKRMASHPGDVAAKLVFGFRLCLVRRPSPQELARLEALYRKLKDKYSDKPEMAKKLGGDPATAALTLTANVILNLDETITKT
jgi:hypothetical protein